MPRRREVEVPLDGLQVVDAADGTLTDLGTLHGVQVVVLMRHRH